MEAELNIVNILKDKPSGTKLYADAFGELSLERVKVNEEDIIHTRNKISTLYLFYNDGKFSKDGESILFPSKEMDDWSKFAWKKGDVLVSEGMGRLHVIFEGFDDDTYTTFKGKHYLCNYDDNEDYNEEEYNDYHKELILRTIEFKKDNVNDAKAYINTIEERFGGKLNLETLEIEKQTEFKDGDIVVTDAVPSMCYSKCIFILKGDLNTGESRANSYVFFNISNNHISYDVLDTIERYRNIHLATDSEKQQLFSALKKEGKAWDAEKKQIVDLKPKWTPKPFDRVITRTPETPWTANFFSHIDSDGIKNCIDDRYIMCLPYNDETAKLIGTTNNWRG